jgi:hypothetical protein
MNYPYSTFILETQRAKQRLDTVFQAQQEPPAVGLSLNKIGSAPARNNPQDAANRLRISSEVSRPRNELSAPGKNGASPNRSYGRRGDMGAVNFTLTLLFFGTVAASQTDRPVLWLLIGPVPLTVGLAIAFVGRKFNLGGRVSGIRALGRPIRKPRTGGSCQCQCQCQ